MQVPCFEVARRAPRTAILERFFFAKDTSCVLPGNRPQPLGHAPVEVKVFLPFFLVNRLELVRQEKFRERSQTALGVDPRSLQIFPELIIPKGLNTQYTGTWEFGSSNFSAGFGQVNDYLVL